VREASDDLTDKRGSPLYQLLDTIVMRRINARADVRQLKQDFEQRVKAVYNAANLTELPELATDITRKLQMFVPDAVLDLAWSEAKIPEIATPTPIAELIEDEFRGAINRKGHGLQRALVFALLQYLALSVPVEVKESDQDAASNTAQSQPAASAETVNPPAQVESAAPTAVQNTTADPEKAPPSVTDPDLILAIEEPELYQHPLRSRNLAAVLLEMTQSSDSGTGARNQVLYTTHSPYFVDLSRFEQLRIAKIKIN